jgi:hypothetical protein
MSTYSTIAPSNELPREVNLVIRDFPEGITRQVLQETLLAAYDDDGSPSEFKAVTVALGQTFSTVTGLVLDNKSASIKATFRDDIDDETLYYHLYCYADGWALPILMKRDGVIHRLFATLNECHPRTPFLKDALWEHQEKKQQHTATEQAARINLAEKEEVIGALREELKRDNDYISILHIFVGKKCSEALLEKDKLIIQQQNHIETLQNTFFEWTRNISRVAP